MAVYGATELLVRLVSFPAAFDAVGRLSAEANSSTGTGDCALFLRYKFLVIIVKRLGGGEARCDLHFFCSFFGAPDRFSGFSGLFASNTDLYGAPWCSSYPPCQPTVLAGGGGPGSPLKACLSGSQGAQERISCLEISSMMMRVTGYLIKTGFNKII